MSEYWTTLLVIHVHYHYDDKKVQCHVSAWGSGSSTILLTVEFYFFLLNWMQLYNEPACCILLKKMFCPDNTVYKFWRSISDGAARKCFLGWFGLTLVTFCYTLFNEKRNKWNTMLSTLHPFSGFIFIMIVTEVESKCYTLQKYLKHCYCY